MNCQFELVEDLASVQVFDKLRLTSSGKAILKIQ